MFTNGGVAVIANGVSPGAAGRGRGRGGRGRGGVARRVTFENGRSESSGKIIIIIIIIIII